MTFVLGLTGSIGMGKSTTAQMFADAGIPVWDADATVRKLYGKGQPAALAISKHYPDAMDCGMVSRAKLRDLISADPKILDHLQKLVHPLVAQDRTAFLDSETAPIVLLDIPLLFETGIDGDCNGIAVVSVPADIQRQRVMARGEMTQSEFEMILARQMPDAEKRARGRWVIDTSTLDGARAGVAEILEEIEQEQANA